MDFMQYLFENYSASVTELSKTGGHNSRCENKGGRLFIENDFKMIDMDFISCKFPGRRVSSVDGLYFNEKNGETHFYMVEFKKMRFDNLDSVDISLYHLKNRREVCGDDENCFFESFDKCVKYLADKTQVGLEIKPMDTLKLLHKLYIQYNAYLALDSDDVFDLSKVYTHDYTEDLKSLEEFSKIKYHYFIVYEFDEFSPNMSNTHEETAEYFKFLDKLKPYPFTTAIRVNDCVFVDDILKEILNNSDLIS